MSSPRQEELRGYQDQVWQLVADYLATLTTADLDVTTADPIQFALAELGLDQVRTDVRSKLSLSAIRRGIPPRSMRQVPKPTKKTL